MSSKRTKPRFYHESDGGPGRKTHYVIDRYANPLGDYRRREVETRGEGRKLARELNENPDRPPWDTIQAERDGYKYTGKGTLCRAGDGDCEELAEKGYDGMCRWCWEHWSQQLDDDE
jgi:hypothetical protein